jgi:hypothetical protein
MIESRKCDECREIIEAEKGYTFHVVWNFHQQIHNYDKKFPPPPKKKTRLVKTPNGWEIENG